MWLLVYTAAMMVQFPTKLKELEAQVSDRDSGLHEKMQQLCGLTQSVPETKKQKMRWILTPPIKKPEKTIEGHGQALHGRGDQHGAGRHMGDGEGNDQGDTLPRAVRSRLEGTGEDTAGEEEGTQRRAEGGTGARGAEHAQVAASGEDNAPLGEGNQRRHHQRRNLEQAAGQWTNTRNYSLS
jgi:hypothetical protein